MKRKCMCIGILLAALLVALCGCQKSEAVSADRGEKQQSGKADEKAKKESQKRTYTFVDVLGEQYKAELLPDVAKHTYDYSRLIDKNGFKYYTDKDGDKRSRLGIDVSEYQPQVDWQQVKAAGVDFAMIRLGYRGYGEAGTLVEDAMYRQHMEQALAAGLDVGVYFFSQAVNSQETSEEVTFVLERISGYKIDCPVVFDTEEIKYDTARTDNLTAEEFTRNCQVFCDQIKAAGYETMIYANMKWLAFTLNLEELEEYEIWYADYEPKPQNPYEIAMWQYTESGTVPGIEGNVDLNVWFQEE